MPSITVAGTYIPGNPAPALNVWFYITFADDVGYCSTMFVMSMPAAVLNGPGGSTIPFAFGELRDAVGTTTSRFYITSAGGGSIVSDTLSIMPGPGVAGGPHTQTITLSLYENGSLVARAPMTITVNVPSACTLPPPDVSALDFSAGISAARVQQGFTQRAVIQGASCSGPGRLTLRAPPMSTSAVPSPGFTSNIDFTATARKGAASAQLSTSTATEAAITVTGDNSPITVDVSLQSGGLPLVAGQYASTLRLTLEPAN